MKQMEAIGVTDDGMNPVKMDLISGKCSKRGQSSGVPIQKVA